MYNNANGNGAENFYHNAGGQLLNSPETMGRRDWNAVGDVGDASDEPGAAMPAATAGAPAPAAKTDCGCDKKGFGMTHCFFGGLLLGIVVTYVFTYKSA